MEYEPFDSSGTDDDLPPPHQNRLPRGGGRFTNNGRSGIGGSMPSYPRKYAENDMEAQIHQLEREAYSSVLRAFKAQADAITWEKESVITELRKELRLSNEEHKELLSQVNADEAIRKIREWRQGNGVQQGIPSSGQGFQELIPSPSVSASRKKQKPSQPVPSQSHGGPLPSVHQQAVNVPHQSFLSSAKRGSVPGSNKGKKHNSGKVLPSASSMKPSQSQYPCTGTNGRGPIDRKSVGVLVNEPTEKASVDPLIGKKVRTRWPEDNHFYEAVIQDHKPFEGLHALVYDKGTTNETWEWVNLAEISPEDIQWIGGEPAILQRGSHGTSSGHVKNRPSGGPIRDNITGPGKGEPKSSKPKFKKEHFPVQNGSGKKIPTPDIRLRRTDTLIEEVERFFTSSRADPREIEEAKKMLKEHEDALVDAISRLGDISDGDHDGKGDRFQRGRLTDR